MKVCYKILNTCLLLTTRHPIFAKRVSLASENLGSRSNILRSRESLEDRHHRIFGVQRKDHERTSWNLHNIPDIDDPGRAVCPSSHSTEEHCEYFKVPASTTPSHLAPATKSQNPIQRTSTTPPTNNNLRSYKIATMDPTTLLLSMARFVSAIARLSLGPLLPLLSVSLGFPESSHPALLSAFSSGYILTQIGGGYVADRYGFAKVIALSTGISALVLAGLASTATSSVGVWTRAYFGLGLVAGPLFPAGSAAIAANVPASQRAASAALVDAAASAGTTVASLAPLLAVGGSWRMVLALTSVGLALVSMVTTTSFSTEATSTNGTANQSSKSIEKNNTMDPKKAIGHWDDSSQQSTLSALLHPLHILTYLCHSADNFSKYSINSWAATMLVAQHQASPALVGAVLGLQEGVGVLSKVLVGVLVPRNSGLASALGFALQGIGLWGAFRAETCFQAGVGLVASALAVGSHSVGFRPIYVQGGIHAGAVSGFGNTIASLASVLGPLAIGAAVQGSGSKDWPMVAQWMLLVNLVGSVAAMGIALLGNNNSDANAQATHKTKEL